MNTIEYSERRKEFFFSPRLRLVGFATDETLFYFFVKELFANINY
jgi:hypothetical protein